MRTSTFVIFLLSRLCLDYVTCLSQDYSFNISDISLKKFVSNFKEVGLPLEIEGEDPISGTHGENSRRIDSLSAQIFLYSEKNVSLKQLEWRSKYALPYYGYRIVTKAGFIMLTHVEHLAVGSYYATNYLSTFSPNGKMISQIVVGEEYDGMVGGTHSSSRIDKDLNVIFSREESENNVETDEDIIKNDIWRIRYAIAQNGRIAQIDSMKIQDANWKPIADNTGPSFSPDGNFVAFASNRNGSYNIWVMDLKTRQRQQVSNLSMDLSPDWSPDGKNIVFHSLGRKTEKRQSDIWTVNLEENKTVNLTKSSNVGDSKPCWSPEGNSIVWTRGKQLWIMDKNGNNARPLTTKPAKKLESCCGWSPDGTTIAYFAQDAYDNHPVSQSELRLIKSDGTSQQRFAGGLRVQGARWSASGQSIYYTSRDALLKISSDGTGDPVEVYKIDWPGQFDFDVSNDDQTIVFSDSGPNHPGKIHVVSIE